MSSSEEFSGSPPAYGGRIAQLRGFLPLSEDASPMATHGHGTLTSLIKSRSTTSMHNLTRRPSSLRGREPPELDEEANPLMRSISRRRDTDAEDFRRSEDRRVSAVLLGPQMRSQRLIGNSNPRYRKLDLWSPSFFLFCSSAVSTRSSPQEESPVGGASLEMLFSLPNVSGRSSANSEILKAGRNTGKQRKSSRR
jgi:hypothetical protein